MIKIYNSMQPLDSGTDRLLQQLLSEQEWAHMRSSLLATLQELTDAFPMDYYPAGAPPDCQHLTSLRNAISALQASWKKAAPAHIQAQAASSAESAGQQQEASTDHAAVTVLDNGQHEPAAAADVFKDPLVVEDSPAARVLARMNTIHLIKLLQELVVLLEQLYEVVEQVGQHMISCKCC
jgi:hypothetical protein